MRKSQTEIAAPVQSEPTEPAQQGTTEPNAPSFTLRASDPFEARAFMRIWNSARVLGCPSERLEELQETMRAFASWKVAYRQ